MADYKLNITPDLHDPTIYISQNDVGREFTIQLNDSAGAYTIPSGSTVTLAGTKPSGLGFTVAGSYDQHGVVTFTTTAGMSDEAGNIYCEVRIVKGDTRIGTANAWLYVEINPHPDDVTDDTAEHLVDTITALVTRAETAAESAEDDASDAERYASTASSAADRAEAALSEFTQVTATATTLAAGSQATASYSEGVLTLGIPKGDKGDTGNTGPQGPEGPPYTLTSADKAEIVADVLTEMDNAETEAM